jgi:hypothetical protein
VKLPLLLLGMIAAVAALTLGAVSLAGSVPTASLSELPSAAATPSPEASQASEVAASAAPATVAVTVTADTITTTVQVVAEPAVRTTPAGCATAIQLAQKARGRLGPAKAVIASTIAECFGQLPVEIQLKITNGELDAADHAGGDSGN